MSAGGRPMVLDASGRLQTVSVSQRMAREVPLVIAALEAFHIPNNVQVLYADDLDIEGEIEDHGGSLVEVN